MSAEQNILQTIQLTNNLITSVHEFAKIIEQWLKENNDNKYLQEIFNHMQNKVFHIYRSEMMQLEYLLLL